MVAWQEEKTNPDATMLVHFFNGEKVILFHSPRVIYLEVWDLKKDHPELITHCDVFTEIEEAREEAEEYIMNKRFLRW